MNAPATFQHHAPLNALPGAGRRGVVRGGVPGGKSLRKTVRAQGEPRPPHRARPRRGCARTFGPGVGAREAVARNYFAQ